MDNFYEILGVPYSASKEQIKRAFREKAKKFHPDIAGEIGQSEMRKCIRAYETLSHPARREEYDRLYRRFTEKYTFDYRNFLQERVDDPESQAKLIFFDLLHLRETDALETWKRQGGLDFPLEDYLDREDWMDCSYILAEELAKNGSYYESFMLLVALVREERRKPYFKHFMEEVDTFLKELVRLKLPFNVDDETLIECLKNLINLGYSKRDEARWLRAMAEALVRLGLPDEARKFLLAALERDPQLPQVATLKRRVGLSGSFKTRLV